MNLETLNMETREALAQVPSKVDSIRQPSYLVKLAQGPDTALAPRGQAGIESVWRSVEGEAQFHDFNAEFFAWVLDSDNLSRVVRQHQNEGTFWDNLRKRGIDGERLEEVIKAASDSRTAFGKHDTYSDFRKLQEAKRIFRDATIIISAPYENERLLVEHNSVGYWNTDYLESRESLIRAAEKSELFKDFIYGYTDEGGEKHEGALDRVLAGNPKVIGLSVTHPGQYVFTFQLARAIRERDPNVITVLAGNLPTRRLDTWVENDETNQNLLRKNRGDNTGLFDAVMVGEGEEPWNILTKKLNERPDISTQELFKHIPSIIYNHAADSDEPHIPEGIIMRRLAMPKNPEEFYHKDRDIYETTPKSFIMPEDEQNHSIVFGRICTYECATGGCNFCSISKGYQEKVIEQTHLLDLESDNRLVPLKGEVEIPRYVLERSPRGTIRVDQRELDIDFLADELVRAYEAGFPIVDFVDEQLTADQIIRIGKAIEGRGLKGKIRYSAYMRIDDFSPQAQAVARLTGEEIYDFTNPETARKLADAGLAFAQFGLETTFPPKIESMMKGTKKKLEQFKATIKNFADHDIMSHVFVIVGNPLDNTFFNQRGSERPFDDTLAGRPGTITSTIVEGLNQAHPEFSKLRGAVGRDVTTNDLEVLEALYNLKFLHEIRDYIFTMKHTQFKLSYASPMANEIQFGWVVQHRTGTELERLMDPEARWGIQVDRDEWRTKDLAPNVPFKYLAGRGPSTETLNNLLKLYDLWKQEEMPYQEVTQELMYHQRLMGQLGARGIRDIAAAINEIGEDKLNPEQKTEERNRLYRLWVQLVGGQEAVRQIQLAKKQPDNRKLQDTVNANLFAREFPNGFQNWEDIYKAVDLVEEIRNGHAPLAA